MISKNLCFKLMKEDLKRRTWTIALTILSLVFTLLVPVAIKCSSFTEDMANVTQEWYRQSLINNLTEMIGVNPMVITVLLGLTAIWAVSGFHYLHNSKQVDFYHSIPVKRHQLFLAFYLDGILVPGAVYLVSQVLSAGLILNTGIGVHALGSVWWKIFLLNMVYYSMIYTTVVIAMMMTGNIIIALLGTGVFLGYGPAVIVLTLGYREMWFLTIYETTKQEMFWLKALRYSSPFADYMFSVENFSNGLLSAKTVIGAVAVTIALAIIAYALYKLRPSERAGKAMAFKKTESPIKVLIAIPAAVVFGMFFYSVRSTVFWGIFGTVCGAVFTCCLMEIIYHFDFRKLFSNRIHLAGCVAVSVLLVLAGIYDWYGFDSWLPNASKVKSASVTLGYSENWITYGEPVWGMDTYRNKEEYSWNYQDQTDYQFEHMELTDIYTIMELAKKGVQQEIDFRKNKKNLIWEYNASFGTPYIIQFQLSNGKTVNRKYYIKQDEEIKELETAIHDSKEYKAGTFPILEQTASDTASVYFQQYNQAEKIPLTPEEKEYLLAVYQKELEELSMADRETELPIGTIQFRNLKLDEAITYNEEHDILSGNLRQRTYYPVYPSFSRTLGILKDAGVKFLELDNKNITSITVEYYWMDDEYNDSRQTIVYNKPEDIKVLAPALVFRDYSNLNRYYQIENASNVDTYISVNFGSFQNYEDRSGMSNFCLNLKNLSEDDIRRFRFIKERSSD